MTEQHPTAELPQLHYCQDQLQGWLRWSLPHRSSNATWAQSLLLEILWESPAPAGLSWKVYALFSAAEHWAKSTAWRSLQARAISDKLRTIRIDWITERHRAGANESGRRVCSLSFDVCIIDEWDVLKALLPAVGEAKNLLIVSCQMLDSEAIEVYEKIACTVKLDSTVWVCTTQCFISFSLPPTPASDLLIYSDQYGVNKGLVQTGCHYGNQDENQSFAAEWEFYVNATLEAADIDSRDFSFFDKARRASYIICWWGSNGVPGWARLESLASPASHCSAMGTMFALAAWQGWYTLPRQSLKQCKLLGLSTTASLQFLHSSDLLDISVMRLIKVITLLQYLWTHVPKSAHLWDWCGYLIKNFWSNNPDRFDFPVKTWSFRLTVCKIQLTSYSIWIWEVLPDTTMPATFDDQDLNCLICTLAMTLLTRMQ